MENDLIDIIQKYQTLLKNYEEKEQGRLIIEQGITKKKEQLKEEISDTEVEIKSLTKEIADFKVNEQNIRNLDTYLIKGLIAGLILALIACSFIARSFAFHYVIEKSLFLLVLTFIPFGFSAFAFFKKYPNTHFRFYKRAQEYHDLLEHKLTKQKEYAKVLQKKLITTNYELEKITNLTTYQKAIADINLIIDYLQSKNFIFDSSYYLISDDLTNNPEDIRVLESKVSSLKLTRRKKEA